MRFALHEVSFVMGGAKNVGLSALWSSAGAGRVLDIRISVLAD